MLPFPATRPLPTYHAAQSAKEMIFHPQSKTPDFISAKQPKGFNSSFSFRQKYERGHLFNRIKQIKASRITGFLAICPIPSFLHDIRNIGCVDKSGNVCCQ